MLDRCVLPALVAVFSARRLTVGACLLSSFFVTSTAFCNDDEVRFARDVSPILSENCFFCHGPDEGQRQAELRLDLEADALGVLGRGEGEESELLRRVLSSDPDEMMPPPDSNRSLSESQKQTLGRWIAAGAAWGKHWSFEPLESPHVPEQSFADFPVRNPIDAIVQRKLLENGLSPSPEAPKHTLIRRLSLDLTGLPPTPDEVAAFLADDTDEAYGRLVDRLLNSPHYGERMAWDWLDAARYADSNGYQGDRERTMWPWRDWVVDAFNSNMPFDEFTVVQLAGDLLPDATYEQKLATGFCRNHMINGEGGRIPAENRVDYVMDMSETMGTVWLGLTLNCCRCHDHKYDPLLQQDYYQFYAFFNQTPVDGGGGDPQTPPNMPALSGTQRDRLDDIEGLLTDLNTQLAERSADIAKNQPAWEAQILATGTTDAWTILQPLEYSAETQTITELDDQSLLVGGANPANDTYTVLYSLPKGLLTAIRLDALRHESMTKGGLARSDSGNFVLTDIACTVVGLDGSETALRIASAEATYEQGGLKVSNAFDDDPKSGWAVHEGRPVDKDHAAVFRFADPPAVDSGTKLRIVLRHDSANLAHNLGRFLVSATARRDAQLSSDSEKLLADLQTARDIRTKDQSDRILTAFLASDERHSALTSQRDTLISEREAINKSAPKVMIMADLDQPRDTFILDRGLYNQPTERQVHAAIPASLPQPAGDVRNRLDLARWLTSDQQPLTARVTVNRFWQQLFGIGLVKTTEDFGVQGEYPAHIELLDWLAADFRDSRWDVKRLLKTIVMSHTYRQSSANRRIEIERDAITSLLPHSAEGARRAESIPSLLPRGGEGARRADEGARPPTQLLSEIDPQNRLLARASRYRMPSWMLRDHALAVSGLLNSDIGGPPINTYQPAGVWEEATFGNKKYAQDTGDKLYRRSLYIFWRRIIGPTMFFDNAPRQTCMVKVLRTNTPLHTLLTFNETTYVESARTLAQSLLENNVLKDDTARIRETFVRVLSRQPTAGETSIMLDGLNRSRTEFGGAAEAATQLLSVGDSPRNETLDTAEHAAWTSLCLAVLNFDEALNRE